MTGAPVPSSLPSGGDEPPSPSAISASRIEAARQSRALTTALGGTCVAIFTFLLFFLYPRYAAGELDPNLFQLTILVIVASVYLLVLAAWFFFLFTQHLDTNSERTKKHLARADGCFGLAVTLLTLAPALVLLTVGLTVLGVVALGMWGIYLLFFVRGILELVGARTGRTDAR